MRADVAGAARLTAHGVKVLVRREARHLAEDARLGDNNEFPRLRLGDFFQHGRRGAHEIRMSEDALGAFGMRQHQKILFLF